MIAERRILVGGVPVDVLSRRGWAARIAAYCRAPRPGRPKVVFAANGQVLAVHAMDPGYRRAFACADGVTADGQPLVWASKLTRHPLPERAATTDLFHDVAQQAAADGLSFFLFGSTERSNAAAAAALARLYPRVRLAGRRGGYFQAADEDEMVAAINALRPDVLWVGLGIRRQEGFVVRNLDRLDQVGCIVTCGGLFDYFTEGVRRAPSWMQRFALEWLFRVWQEPRKYLRRYLTTNPVALFLLLTNTRTHARSRWSRQGRPLSAPDRCSSTLGGRVPVPGGSGGRTARRSEDATLAPPPHRTRDAHPHRPGHGFVETPGG